MSSVGIVTAVVVGAGQRGNVYASYAFEQPTKFKVVGVAEPREFARTSFASRHGIPSSNVFTTWEAITAVPRLADVAIITTQDSMHVGPAVELAKLGYHILLEKPMAVSAADCSLIVSTIKSAGVLFAVGHVLRYTPYMQKIISLLRSGVIGDVMNIQHLEPIGYYHFAHSFVRGSWSVEDKSSFLLMTKCCHDVDLLRYMMGRPIERVSSFGSLMQFRKDKQPEGAASRCVDCPAAIESQCAYSALKIYREPATRGVFSWPVAPILNSEPSLPAVEEALKTGPYGRCVWASDNDVCDNQVVSLSFEGGATASLTTVACTEKICQRSTRIYGSKGELEGDGESTIRHYDFLKRETIIHTAPPPQRAPLSKATEARITSSSPPLCRPWRRGMRPSSFQGQRRRSSPTSRSLRQKRPGKGALSSTFLACLPLQEGQGHRHQIAQLHVLHR